MLSLALSHCLRRKLISLGLCAGSLLLVPVALSRESLRSELARLQEQNGLALVSVSDNKIYVVAFANRSLNESMPFPGKGTVVGGDFSEDGTRIAVALCRDPGITQTPKGTACPGGFVFAIMRADGSESHEYRDLANPLNMTCWSHDGSKLALVVEDRRKGSYAEELQILDLATEGTQVIANGHNAFVDPQCWSPDDKHVVYTSNNYGGHGATSIYDVDLKTSREFSKGTRATWSPDGKWIALMECPPSLWGCKYYIVRPSGSERKLLFKSESATALWWSPDSRFVAYVNGARISERTPAQQLREMDRLRVRRLEDNSEESFKDFFDGDALYFQWVKNTQVNLPPLQPSLAH